MGSKTGTISTSLMTVVSGSKFNCSGTIYVETSSEPYSVGLKISKSTISSAINSLLPSGSIATGFSISTHVYSAMGSYGSTCYPSGAWSQGTAYLLDSGRSTITSSAFHESFVGDLSSGKLPLSYVGDIYISAMITNYPVMAYVRAEFVDASITVYYETCALNSISVSRSPSSLSKPGSVTFTCATASCNDSSCPTSFSYRYSASGGGVSTSGTGRTATVSLTSAGTCTCTFTVSGCGGDSKTGSASCTLASRSKSGKYKATEGGSWASISSGSSITAMPGGLYLQYNNSYCGASGYNSYILRKKDTDSEYEVYASTSSETAMERQMSFSEAGTYNIKFAYGTSSSKTDDLSFNIVVEPMTTSGKVGDTNPPTSNVVTGANYPYTAGSNKTIYFKYSNNYGSSLQPLHILVDDVRIETAEADVVTGSYVFDSSKTVTVTYAYGSTDSPTVDYEFSVTVSGIITGTPIIEVNGVQMTPTADNPNVASFYPNTLSIVGIQGYDETATFSWSVTSPSTASDYDFSSEGAQATLKCKNATKEYRVACTITSYGHNVNVTMNNKYITCTSKTVALFEVDPEEGEPTTTRFTTINAEAIAPTASGTDVVVDFIWEMCDEFGYVISPELGVYTTVSGGGESDSTWVFYFNQPGVFNVKLTADPTRYSSVSSYEKGYSTFTVVVNRVDVITQPVQNRYAIILYNKTYSSVVDRTNSNVLFMDLNFSSGLNTIGKCSFQIVGGNNMMCEGVSSSASLLTTGTNVVVVDNLCPVWVGKISAINEVNINYYQKYTTTRILNVECDEAIKELSYQYIPSDKAVTVSGMLEDIVKEYIIPEDNRGTFGVSTIQYAISLSTSSRLTALDSLSSQSGWRYRCRPNVTIFNGSITISGTSCTVNDGSKLKSGDLLIIYDNASDVDGPGMYCAAVVNTISGNNITIYRRSKVLDNGTYHFTSYRGFLVDYRPAYYQNTVPLELDINDCAQNVDSTSTSADKFGEVSVFGVGNSGETISSNMRAWMAINPNYTIDNSARVKVSYDSTIDSINTLGDVVLNGYIWTRFAVTVNGWSFPTQPDPDHLPTIFYKRQNGDVLKMELRGVAATISRSEVNKFVDQSSTEKTQFVCAFVAGKEDGSEITTDDIYYDRYADAYGRKYVDILSSMPVLTNIVFNHMIITSDNVLTKILPTTSGSEILIGDNKVRVKELSSSGYLEFTWIETEGGSPVKVAPHGHLTDVLVMDNTGTKHNTQGYKYDNPDPNSPYGKYGDVTISIQGAEGYSRMELERLACRYMQYGSNYSDRGSCQVILNAFIKSDYDIGCRKILTPGDRFVLNKVTSSSGSSTISTALNYELLSYNVSLNSNMVTVSFGMPFVELNDVIYNMLSNAGMSIMASSSDIDL